MSFKKHSFSQIVLWTLTTAMFVIGGGGCSVAPKQFVEGVDVVTAQYKVRDAKVQRVKHYPYLRTDDVLTDRLEHALASEDLAEAVHVSGVFIDRAHTLAISSVNNELERLDESGLQNLRDWYFNGKALSRQQLVDTFVTRTGEQASALSARIAQVRHVNELRAVLRPIRRNIETPIKHQGRFARMMPWFLFTIPSRMMIDHIYKNEYRENADARFESAVVYIPISDDNINTPNSDILARYSPLIVQECPLNPSYAKENDCIGTVIAKSTEVMAVDPTSASVYAYAREVCIQGEPHLQLIYTHWYPEHPSLKKDDPEAGHIEGVTLRITLDRDQRPAMFETVYNCGCYYRIYPAHRVEQAATQEFGPPVKDKQLSLERSVSDRKDVIVLNTVEVADARPVIRVRAGWHGIVDVGFDVGKHNGEPHTSATYTLRPYEQLERLVTPDGKITSLFYDNGLVKGAQRLEGVYFTPAGLLSAGQPRQRGTQMVEWDDWNFDDPHLFQKALRLPSSF